MTTTSELHSKIQSGKILLGCAIDSGLPANAEIAAMLGFDLVWADLEHGSVSPHQAELFCQAVKAGGALPILRIQSATRTHVLRALEAGASLVVVPMVENPKTSRQIVEQGKYKPLGERGFNGSSRGLRYGIGNPLANMEWANRETHLFVQIETVEALRCCEELVAMEGISGGVVGPGDLSVSMGKPLAFDDPEMSEAVGRAVRAIRSQNKIAMLVSGHSGLAKAAVKAGVNILVCAGERPSLRAHWQQSLKEMAALIHAS